MCSIDSADLRTLDGLQKPLPKTTKGSALCGPLWFVTQGDVEIASDYGATGAGMNTMPL